MPPENPNRTDRVTRRLTRDMRLAKQFSAHTADKIDKAELEKCIAWSIEDTSKEELERIRKAGMKKPGPRKGYKANHHGKGGRKHKSKAKRFTKEKRRGAHLLPKKNNQKKRPSPEGGKVVDHRSIKTAPKGRRTNDSGKLFVKLLPCVLLACFVGWPSSLGRARGYARVLFKQLQPVFLNFFRGTVRTLEGTPTPKKR